MRLWPCVLVMSVAACSPDYPFDKPGTWRLGEFSANDANLQAMIVNPHDLVEGAGATTSIGPEAGAPVRRLLTGRRYPLPSSNLLQLNVVGEQAAAQPPAQGGESNAGQ
jgi:hypothetical protein